MGLSDRDIALFARDAVAEDSLGAPNEASRLRRLAAAQANACGYYETVQREIRRSGYRITQRVKQKIWDELTRIKETARENVGPAVAPQPSARDGASESD